MKAGIIGLPQTGKKTLFRILTQTGAEVRQKGSKPVPGTADIVDSRFDVLADLYQPKKNVRARIDLVLLPALEKESIAGGEIFRDIADLDAICHVVRCFEDDSIYHPAGSVAPLRDVETVNSELLMHDQIFVEKRIDRIKELTKKKKDADQEKELALLEKMKSHLEEEQPLRLMTLSEDEDMIIRSYPFITRKEMILAFNVSEDDLETATLPEGIDELCRKEKMEAMIVSAAVEEEIASLDTDEEKDEFLQELGIKETALENLTRLCLRALGLISFFTVGEDEVRQWLVRANSKAPRAAGVIHSDLERGFIRAEVMTYDELMEYKTEAALKKAGKMRVEGKDYTVSDGDILNIRFKV